MAHDTNSDAPVDLYVAAYADPDAARADWDAIKQLAKDDVIEVDGLVLVSHREDGKIHVDDDFRETAKGAKWGAVGGAFVGLIFPPSLLASAVVGAGLGAGVGSLRSHRTKSAIEADVESTLPLNSSGIVAIFEERWEPDVDGALGRATAFSREGRAGERRGGESGGGGVSAARARARLPRQQRRVGRLSGRSTQPAQF